MRAMFALGVACLIEALAALPANAQGTEVTLAGLAYSGENATIGDRFPLTKEYDASMPMGGAYQKLRAAIASNPPQHLQLSAGLIEELKGRDQAVVTSLVLDSETVSVEEFGVTRKLLVLIRGQAIFFDFKSMTVLRSYPVSFAYIDPLDHAPSHEEKLEAVRQLYEGTPGKPGLFERYAKVLATASLPSTVPRFLRVTNVKLASDVVAVLPAYLKDSPATYENWAADMVSEAISSRMGVPIIPYASGNAVGKVMSMQVADGTVYELKLPAPDYKISVDFSGLKKVKFAEVGGGASFIYGTYADVRIEEPMSGTVYLNTRLKNGEVKVVPHSQTYVDDFPAYNDSLNGLFQKLADAVAGKGNTWVKAAAAAPDIEAQILKTNGLIKLCK
jgi:hypothetical protein